MSESNYKNHPKNPSNQAFNVSPKPGKKRGWCINGHNNSAKKEPA